MISENQMKWPFSIDSLALLLLCALATAIWVTNSSYGVMDDEAYQVGSAAQPLAIVATQFKTSEGQLHPPLPDIILHFWLHLTRNSLTLLRVPSTLFLVLGIWVGSRVAKRVGGDVAAGTTLVLGVLWPFGFEFGRYAVWNSFCFFLLACLLYTYVQWIEQPILTRSCMFLLVSIALLYTNYMGWAFLLAVGLDFLFRPERHSSKHRQRIAMCGGILVICYLPVWPGLVQSLQYRSPVLSARAFLTFLYSFYVLIASESIAPWVLALSVPISICLAICSVIILFRGPRVTRVIYACVLLMGVALAISGEINQKRVMPLAAWMLPSAGISIGCESPRYRRLLVIGFVVIGTISWVGIVSHRFYSTARSLEPWAEIARAATPSVLSGDTLIASHPAFFFYLTREVMKNQGIPIQEFRGNYGEQVQRAGVYNVRQWALSGHPTSARVLFIATLYGTDYEPTVEASDWLDEHCRRESTERFVPNPHYEVKGRVFGPSQGSPWRIEVRKYRC